MFDVWIYMYVFVCVCMNFGVCMYVFMYVWLLTDNRCFTVLHWYIHENTININKEQNIYNTLFAEYCVELGRASLLLNTIKIYFRNHFFAMYIRRIFRLYTQPRCL